MSFEKFVLIMLVAIAVTCMITYALSDLKQAGLLDDPEPITIPVRPAVWEPNRQFVVDEVCVNYECHKGIVLVSVNDKMLFVSKDGKTIMVPVLKMEIIKDHYFFVFEEQRGFFSIGIYDNVAFMYLDKDNIVLHLYKSSINPNKQ